MRAGVLEQYGGEEWKRDGWNGREIELVGFGLLVIQTQMHVKRIGYMLIRRDENSATHLFTNIQRID